MKVSVIIRTYNEERWIGTCLQRVFSQDFDGDIEVIIVDSYSTDKTIEIAKQYDTKIVYLPYSPGRSINYGIENSDGEYIIILSAHAIPVDNKWMHNLIKNLDDPNVAGVYGKHIPHPDCNPLEVRTMLRIFGPYREIHTEGCFFHNANSAIRRSLWKEIPFREEMEASEDQAWAKEVQGRGYVIIYDPSAAVMHSHNETLKQTYKRHWLVGFTLASIQEPIPTQWFILRVGCGVLLDWFFILRNGYSPKWLLISPFQKFTRCLGLRIGSNKGSRQVKR